MTSIFLTRQKHANAQTHSFSVIFIQFRELTLPGHNPNVPVCNKLPSSMGNSLPSVGKTLNTPASGSDNHNKDKVFFRSLTAIWSGINEHGALFSRLLYVREESQNRLERE